MALRYRERYIGTIPGGWLEATAEGLNDIQVDDSFAEGEYTYDAVDNPGGMNPFLNVKHRLTFARITGKVGFGYKAHNVPVNSRANFAGPPAGWPTDTQAVTEFLARTNPSRASVDVFTFLAELKDLPKMVKSVGQHFLKKPNSFPDILKRFSGQFLNYQFGWAPLLSDLGKLVDFTEVVNNRVRELESLKSGKGLRRKYTAFDVTEVHSDFSGDFYPVVVYSAECTARADLLSRYRKWVTGTWRPTSTTPILSGDAQLELARSLVFGHNISPKQVWDLMPWTWLIDWFSTTGDFIAANRNHIGATCTDVCVMTNAVGAWTNVRLINNPYGAHLKRIPSVGWEHKERQPASAVPSLEVKLPFLSGRQLSILSALAVVKGLR